MTNRVPLGKDLTTGQVGPLEVGDVLTDAAVTALIAAAASQGEAEAGTEAALRSFSPLRVAQAIAALGGGSFEPLDAQYQSVQQTISYVVPGGTLAADNDFLLFFGFGATNTTWALNASFGGTSLAGGTATFDTIIGPFWGFLQRMGASSQYFGMWSRTGGVGASAAKDMSVDQTLLFTRSGADALNGPRSLVVIKVSAP